MDAALATIRASPSAGDALTMASKLLTNILSNSEEPKYRRIRTTNAKLQAALFSVPGGRELMLACGFTDSPPDELVELRARCAELERPPRAAVDGLSGLTQLPVPSGDLSSRGASIGLPGSP